MAEEQHGFQAEVGKLLDIVAHSLYSEKQIFLRELISNASDACDRLRYEALTKPELTAGDPDFKIRLNVDTKARTLTVEDNGVGMNHDELVDNLGTIARSGTAAFVEQMSGDTAAYAKLIGQFGVGFYASFMVAEKVDVVTRRAGEAVGWRWVSDGKGAFTIEEADDAPARGTRIRLHLKKDAKEFLEPARLGHIVRTYSDHIALPIVLAEEGKEETINTASALWTRPKKDISAEQYTEFYRHAGHAVDEPWLTLHYKAEGKLEYTSLLYVPSIRPYDLFDPIRQTRVKLYVRRVFITDDCDGLLPPWLRFLRGIVDSEDLPLNISRETLQDNPLLAKIRVGLVKRVLTELGKKAEKAPDEYAAFWENFGAVLKEGIYEEPEQKDKLIGLCRFRSTASDELTNLAEYRARMKDGQEAIYYIAGDEPTALARSPQLEGFAAREVEVLLMTDTVDEFWVPNIGEYDELPFRSVTHGGVDLDKIAKVERQEDEKSEAEAEVEDGKNLDNLIALFKLALKDEVKDVRSSERLTDSPVCLVSDEGDLDMHLERILKAHRQVDVASKRILEINPGHPLMARLGGMVAQDGQADRLAEMAFLLLDQARIVEGEPLPDPAAFSRRLSSFLEQGLAT